MCKVHPRGSARQHRPSWPSGPPLSRWPSVSVRLSGHGLFHFGCCESCRCGHVQGLWVLLLALGRRRGRGVSRAQGGPCSRGRAVRATVGPKDLVSPHHPRPTQRGVTGLVGVMPGHKVTKCKPSEEGSRQHWGQPGEHGVLHLVRCGDQDPLGQWGQQVTSPAQKSKLSSGVTPHLALQEESWAPSRLAPGFLQPPRTLLSCPTANPAPGPAPTSPSPHGPLSIPQVPPLPLPRPGICV